MDETTNLPRREDTTTATGQPTMFAWWIALLVTAVATPLAWWMEITRPLIVADEGWFMQLATRIANGDVLYRDVYAPVTPLSVWVTAGAVKLLGSDVWVLRSVILVAWALALLLGLLVLRRLRLPWPATIPVAAAMVTLNPPGACGPGSAYNPIAQALLVGTMLASLMWLDAETPKRRILVCVAAGVLTGLTLATKQNLGALAIGGFIGTTAVLSVFRRDWKEALITTAVSGGTAAGVLVFFLGVVKLQSAFEEMLRYAFAGQSTYVKEGTLLYRDGVIAFFTNFAPPVSLANITQSISLIVFFLPYLAIGLPLVAWAWKRVSLGYVLLVWGATGFLAAYPRWDTPHLDTGTPLMLLAIAGALNLLFTSKRARTVTWVCITALAIVCLGVMVSLKATQIANGSLRRVDIPHFSGVYVRYDAEPLRDQRRVVTSVRLLQRIGAEKKIVILGYRSGFLYLAAGIDNPTPYDYAAGGIIGPREGWEILKLYEQGKVDAVWVDQSNRIPDFPQTRFARWLDQKWEPTVRTAYGTLYEPSEEWKSRLEAK